MNSWELPEHGDGLVRSAAAVVQLEAGRGPAYKKVAEHPLGMSHCKADAAAPVLKLRVHLLHQHSNQEAGCAFPLSGLCCFGLVYGFLGVTLFDHTFVFGVAWKWRCLQWILK